jgi:hypothetical protein
MCVFALLACGSDLTMHVVEPVSTPAECYACPADYKGAQLGEPLALPWLCEYPDLDLVMRCEPVACDDYGEPVCEPVPAEGP